MTLQRFSGKQYLQIDIANNFGLDKEDWNTRLHWFQQHKHKLLEMVPEAEDPALMYAGILAYEKMKAGEPVSYPVSLDATASGMQILACLTSDRTGAMQCNVVDSGKREDAYTNVYNHMCNITGDSSKIVRSDAKAAVMTSLYGSEAQPKRVFGEGALLRVFHETMETLAPYVWELNQVFLDMWQPDAYSNDWVLPDGFEVKIKVMDKVKETVHFLNEPFEVFTKVNQPIEKGRSLSANVTHSLDGLIVREMIRRCDYNPKDITRILSAMKDPIIDQKDNDHSKMVDKLWRLYKESGFLSARILQHLRADNLSLIDSYVPIKELIESLPEKPFKVATVHDCFRVLAPYGNDLRIQYNIQLASIAKSDLLSFIISQILGRTVSIGKADPNMWKDVLNSNYALS